MQKQVYGTIRRVLSDGVNGTPWIAEVVPYEEEGTIFLEMASRPAATVGDDLLVNADVEQHPDGRQIGKATGFTASEKAALTRLLAATADLKPGDDFKVVSRIAAARRNKDTFVRLTDDALAVIRPTIAANSTLQMLARHGRSSLVTDNAPRYLVNPLVHVAAQSDSSRMLAAEPAGLSKRISMRPGPSFARVGSDKGETWGLMIDPGGADTCSYTTLMGVSGKGLLSKRDVPANLHQEFVTAHEYGHTLDRYDDERVGLDRAEIERRRETFADAFAVTELAMSGRSLTEIERIITAREAAIIGTSFLGNGQRLERPSFVHCSGAAARMALNGARRALESGVPVTAADIVAQARRVSDHWTITPQGVRDLKQALQTLPARADKNTISALLGKLAKTTSDQALKFNAESLKARLDSFFSPDQHADVARKIASLHAHSMRQHVDYVSAQGVTALNLQIISDAEKSAWDIPDQTRLQRLAGRIGLGSATLPSLLRANIETIVKAVGAPSATAPEDTAFVRIPDPRSDIPNPWTFSVSDRLQRAASYGAAAYRANVAATKQGTASYQQTEAFSEAMRGLSAFAEAVTLRDPTKDSRTVRRILDAKPDLEDNLKIFAAYRPSDVTLPLAEGKRLHLHAVINAIDPRLELEEIVPPVMPNPFGEFTNDVAPAGDRD